MDVAQCHLQIIVHGREIASAQLLVDRHQVEIGLRERLRDVDSPLGRHAADQLQAARELGARLAPACLAERGRDRIAVEHRERPGRSAPRVARCRRPNGPQHAFDHLGHHGEPQRKGAPARVVDGFAGTPARETGPSRNGRRVRASTRRCPSAPGRPRCSSMKSASACGSRIGGRRRKMSNRPMGPSGMGVAPGTRRQCRSRLRSSKPTSCELTDTAPLRKSYNRGRHAVLPFSIASQPGTRPGRQRGTRGVPPWPMLGVPRISHRPPRSGRTAKGGYATHGSI